MKILITDGLEKEGVDMLAEAGFECDNRKMDAAELEAQIKGYNALIIRSATKVTKNVLEKAENLSIIARAGVGYDNVDVAEASKRGIVVKIAPEGNTNAAAEHAVFLMGAISRNICQAYSDLKQGTWVKKKYQGYELAGKKVGIIGCGRIGQSVARKLRNGFDMEVYGYDSFVPVNILREAGIIPCTLDELLTKADYVTLHTPGLGKPIIGADELSKMKKSAYLINVSRGKNVDEAALYDALTSKEIAGAASDVFKEEAKEGKPFSNRLMDLPNFIGLPHLGASTHEAQKKTAIETARRVISFAKCGDITDAINLVDAEKTAQTYQVQIHHKDLPGVFAQISAVFSKNGYNIAEIPSRKISPQHDQGYAVTLFCLEKKPDDKVMAELKTIKEIRSARYVG